MNDDREPHVGYVLEVYPRFSETFIVTEVLAREARGERVTILALRPTDDSRFHAEISRVRAPVHHIPLPVTADAMWRELRTAASDPALAARMADHLPALLQADAEDLAQAAVLARSARAQGITHLHAHFATRSTSVARLASLLSGIPYSFTAHAVDLFHRSVRHGDLREKCRDAAFVATVSDYNARFLRDRIGAHNVHRVYNGLDLSRFPFIARAPGRPGGTGGVPHVVAVGRLVEKKGFALLIEAVARLHRAGAVLRVDIAGGGVLEGALREQIVRSGLSDSIRLLGPVPQHEVAELLAHADVFVAPCIVAADGNADGLPTVLLEAMATGVPCISTDVTGIPEVVRDADTGLLCRAGDIDDLVAALRTALATDFDRVSITRRARTLIEREFDARRQAETLATLTARAGARSGDAA